MAEFYTILTDIGLAKFSNAQITEDTVDLTEIAVGDSNGDYYEPDSSATALINEVWRGNVSLVEVDAENPNWVNVETIIPPQDGGFNIREIGLFDASGDMIAVGKYPESYKPVLEEGSSRDYLIRMIIETSNAESVALKLDPSAIIATRDYVDRKFNQVVYPVTSVNGKIGDVELSASDVGAVTPNELEEKVNNHENKQIHLEEVHGMRVNPSTNRFEYYNGTEYVEVYIDQEDIRDNQDLRLRVQVRDTSPSVADGRIYYNTTDQLFYIGRNGQWWRLYVAGDEKVEQSPPSNAPELESKTDTTIKLVSYENMEYKYESGDWQESSLFAGLERNTSYTFYSRFKEDEVYKSSPSSPSDSYTTDKGTQSAPSAPNVSDIQHNQATVSGGSGTEVRLGSGSWYDSPHTFTGLTEKTQYTTYARRKETTTHYASDQSSGANFTTPSMAPGPSNLVDGDENAGYFGAVSASELITGDQLASEIGLTAGTSQHSNSDWLKFSSEGQIIFSPMKTFRYNLSWDDINAANAVYGDKTITVNGMTFKVRLWRGANSDPTSDYNGTAVRDSEWNKLMLPIHENAPSSWEYPDNVNSPTEDWGVNFSDQDLLTHNDYGDGSYTWCQETYDTSNRVYRGYSGVSNSDYFSSDYTSSNYGWRPVLELI